MKEKNSPDRVLSFTPLLQPEEHREEYRKFLQVHKMTTSMLNHLLSHNLATNDSIPASINYVAPVVETQRLVSRVEQEEGTNGPTLHR